MQKDIKIAQQTADLAQYRGYLERLHIQAHEPKHGNERP